MSNSSDHNGKISPPSAATEGIDYDAWRKNIRSDTFGSYHFNMAFSIFLRNEGEASAIEHLYRAQQHLPNRMDIGFLLVLLLQRIERTQDALTVREQYARANPAFDSIGFRDVLVGLAEMGEHEKLLAWWAYAPANALFDGLTYALLAQAHIKLGQIEEARTAFEQAVGATPSAEANELIERLQSELGSRFIENGRHGAASAIFQQAIKAIDSDPRIFLALARVRCLLLDIPGAEQAFERSLELTKDNSEIGLKGVGPVRPIAFHGLGMAQIVLKRFSDAEQAFQRSAMTSPLPDDVWPWVAYAMTAGGRHNEAEEYLLRLLKTAPETGESWSHLGLALHSMGRLEEASKAHARALKLASGNCWCITNAALLEAELHGEEAALRLHREAIATSTSKWLHFQALLRPWTSSTLMATYSRLGHQPPA